MSGNGARIAGMATIKARPPMALPGQLEVAARVSFAAVRGTTIRRTSARPTATADDPVIRDQRLSASVLPGLKSLIFPSLPVQAATAQRRAAPRKSRRRRAAFSSSRPSAARAGIVPNEGLGFLRSRIRLSPFRDDEGRRRVGGRGRRSQGRDAAINNSSNAIISLCTRGESRQPRSSGS